MGPYERNNDEKRCLMCGEQEQCDHDTGGDLMPSIDINGFSLYKRKKKNHYLRRWMYLRSWIPLGADFLREQCSHHPLQTVMFTLKTVKFTLKTAKFTLSTSKSIMFVYLYGWLEAADRSNISSVLLVLKSDSQVNPI